jgi:maltooligosyltrehalose trehalohydrolase
MPRVTLIKHSHYQCHFSFLRKPFIVNLIRMNIDLIKLMIERKFPVGAELFKEGTHFRVWAPGKKTVDVVLFNSLDKPGKKISLENNETNYFQGLVPDAKAGTLYKFDINGIDDYYPDPASYYQPFGPHGPSQVIDHNSFKWDENNWKGVDKNDLIIYEMHIGTFTMEGTWKAAEDKLKYLADTGINLLEIMPIAEFPGEFNWGYDGVMLFAPSHLYGRPDDFKSFINAAHNLGIGVILDVVYNHLGPDGNYLGKYSDDYTTNKYKTDWGAAINYDGKNSYGVREFFMTNAVFWTREYHLDGLRLDATQDIYDESGVHILAEIHDQVRKAAKGKPTYIVTENEPQNCELVKKRDKGGIGFDSMWNDDFHHTAIVALTGKREAYYTDYYGSPQEFISALKYGFLYQGQYYKWQKKRRGRPAFELKPEKLVHFIQNHDQIANSARGLRIDKLSSPAMVRAMTAVMFLGPQTPMLFQGQEFSSSSPFLFFADHKQELGESVSQGRKEFLSQFRSIASKEMTDILTEPDKESFLKSKLDHSERERHKESYKFHKDLITLRRNDPVLRLKKIDGAVLGEKCFLIRYFQGENDRLLLVNFGRDLDLNPAPEPLLAPVEGRVWEILWSSEDPSYGGGGTAHPETKENWVVPGHAAILLKAAKPMDENGKNNKKN